MPANRFPLLVAWPALLILAYFLLRPGVSGAFLLDDFSNLPALSAMGRVNNFLSLKEYLNSGIGGPGKRPISLLSFLIDDNRWPSDPRSFKSTNLLIHLLNASLLFWLIYSLLRLDSDRTLARAAGGLALATAGVWLLHPLQLSTVFYVVQRMAQLSTLFMLAAMVLYLKGRAAMQRGAGNRGLILITTAVVIGTLLASLSKENGAVLPLLLLVMEATIAHRWHAGPLPKWWRNTFLLMPTLLITAYLFYVPIHNGWLAPYPQRDFSPVERLLTETRMTALNLYHWIIPRLLTPTLYYDGVNPSRGLLEPPSTLAALFFVAIALSLAVGLRKSRPYVAFAILFFFASQILEISTVGLELNWEHRTYLASAFLAVPIFIGINESQHLRKWAPQLLGAVLLLLAVLVHLHAKLWGDPYQFAQAMARAAPNSVRAQRTAASMLILHKQQGAALELLRSAIQRRPQNLSLRLDEAALECFRQGASSAQRQSILVAARHFDFDNRSFKKIKAFIGDSAKLACRGLDNNFSQILLDLLLEQKQDKGDTGWQWQLYFLKAKVALWQDDLPAALDYFEVSIRQSQTVDSFLLEAAMLADHAHYRAALDVLSKAQKFLASPAAKLGTSRSKAGYRFEIEHLRDTIRSELADAGSQVLP